MTRVGIGPISDHGRTFFVDGGVTVILPISLYICFLGVCAAERIVDKYPVLDAVDAKEQFMNQRGGFN